MEEKKFRELPVLVKPGYAHCNIADALARIVEKLIKEMVPIADAEKDGYEFYDKTPWGSGAHMEVLSEVVETVELKEPRFAFSASVICSSYRAAEKSTTPIPPV